MHPTKTDNNKTENNKTESVSLIDRQTDEIFLQTILDNCELEIWNDNTGEVFESVIREVYFQESLYVGGKLLNRAQLRDKLSALSADALIRVHDNMTGKRITNPHAYLIRAIVNAADDYAAEQLAYSVV